MVRSATWGRSGSGLPSAGDCAWSTRLSLCEQGEQRQVVADMPRDEEIPAYVLPRGCTHAPDQLRVAEEMPDAEGGAFNGLYRVARHAEDDLVGNTAGETAEHRLALPHGGGHIYSEDFAAGRQRLVNHDGGAALERGHLCLRIRRQHHYAQGGIVAGRPPPLR